MAFSANGKWNTMTVTAILSQLAGTTVYFSFNTEFTDLEERNLQIRDDFYSGAYDLLDLARKYHLSVSRVYKIIQTRQSSSDAP